MLADIVGNTVLPFFKQPVKKNTFGHYEEEGLIETYYMIWMVNSRRRAWSRRRRELSERASRLGMRARCATQSCDKKFWFCHIGKCLFLAINMICVALCYIYRI